MAASKLKEQIANYIGNLVAKTLFDKRSKNGNRNVEVHVTEEELAQLVSVGVQLALDKAGY